MIIEVLRAFDYKIREGTVHKSKLEGLEMGRHEWVHDYTYVLVSSICCLLGKSWDTTLFRKNVLCETVWDKYGT